MTVNGLMAPDDVRALLRSSYRALRHAPDDPDAHRGVWTLAVLAAIGDVVTTLIGLQIDGVVEANSVMLELWPALGGPLPGMILAKALVLALGVGVWIVARRYSRAIALAVPAAFVLVWQFAVVVNVVVILVAA